VVLAVTVVVAGRGCCVESQNPGSPWGHHYPSLAFQLVQEGGP
jgi:hypothetical protein